MASPDKRGVQPFVERYGPLLPRLRQQRKPPSAYISKRFADLRVGAPANDKLYMSKHQPFEYSPIPGPGYIRVLHLSPPVSANVAELRGSLRLHKLDGPSRYDAVSYAWGEFPNFNQVIVLDGKVLKITENLYAALMAFCRPDRVRLLWADAICINQADAIEKAQQVALMADIYSKAMLVQVWLTLPSEWARDAMKFLRDLSSRANRFGISKDVGQPRMVEDLPSVNITRSEAERLISDAVKHHVDFLLYRPWFNRVWVVQEVALATDLVVSCGHTKLTWTELARAVEVLRGAYRHIPIGEDRSRMEGLKAAWPLVKHRDEWRMADKLFDRNHHVSTNMVGRQMSNKDCSDDRDRVYAMLSMTRSPHSGMVPDYTKTVAEAYTEFTRRYSPNTQIYWAGLARRQPTVNEQVTDNSKDVPVHGEQVPFNVTLDITHRDYLPSWVPEFRPSRNLAWAAPFDGSYRTACATPFFFLSHPETSKVMLASGQVIDMIQHTSSNFDTKARHCFDNPAFFFPLITLLTHLLDNPPPASQTLPDPFPTQLAKTLTSGIADCPHAEAIFARYHFISELPSRGLTPGSLPWLTTIWSAFATHCLAPTGEIYQRFLLRAIGGPATRAALPAAGSAAATGALSPDAQLAFAFFNYLANILVPNRLFVTHGGRIGLAPGIARPGDMLVVVNGCHMPYVMRSVRKAVYGEGSVEWALQVVGPVYLHGVMRGEIVEERGEEKWEGLRWTRHEGDEADCLEGWLKLV